MHLTYIHLLTKIATVWGSMLWDAWLNVLMHGVILRIYHLELCYEGIKHKNTTYLKESFRSDSYRHIILEIQNSPVNLTDFGAQRQNNCNRIFLTPVS